MPSTTNLELHSRVDEPKLKVIHAALYKFQISHNRPPLDVIKQFVETKLRQMHVQDFTVSPDGDIPTDNGFMTVKLTRFNKSGSMTLVTMDCGSEVKFTMEEVWTGNVKGDVDGA